MLYSVLITPSDLINILYVIYFIYCGEVLSAQSKPQPGNAGLRGQFCLFLPWSLSLSLKGCEG